jgi:predicted phosphoribosyltransferase
MERAAMIGSEVMFENRREAGRRLAAAMQPYKGADAVVLALPRGGVPVAFEIAKSLEAPLDVLLVRKIGVPGQEELAVGAVIDGPNPQLVLNKEIARHVSPAYIEAEEERQLAEIERRRRLYGNLPPVDVSGRTAIVVDDGIATGATMKAGLRGIARNRPRKLVMAVPVAPVEALDELGRECDEIVCLATPDPFYAVGMHYYDFSPTTDEEVVDLLIRAREEWGPRSRGPLEPVESRRE